MPGRTLQADAAALRDKVNTQVPKILEQAQITTANHQKNLVALHKLQEEAAQCEEPLRKGRGVKLVGEKIFEEAVLQMLMRVLPIKKGVVQADRVVKFVAQYIRFVNEKAGEARNGQETEGDDEEEPTASRFTARLLKFLFKGFLSKDKSVRYRVLQTVAEMVSHLGEVEHGDELSRSEDIYSELRSLLLDRVHDKESTVRVQVVIALSKLAGSDDPSDLEDGEQTILEVLLDTLEHDSSSDVRRAALLNIDVNSETLPIILGRTRDTDTTIRKLVYSAVLETNVTVKDTEDMGPTHPRAFTIAQRESIIRNGLGDREPSVRAAAASLLGAWVDAVEEQIPKDEEEKQGVKVESGLVELLKMLDLNQQEYPVDAVMSIFVSRTEIFDTMTFSSAYWENLTPETAFLARVFVDHGRAIDEGDARLDSVLPVVTEMAFRIQAVYNKLDDDITAEEEARLLQDLTEEEKTKYEDARLADEAIIGELLQLAVNLDYSDEIGRRSMFQLVRDMLSKERLPQSLLNKCLDVLRKLSDNERDLIRVVVELVQDLRDRARVDDEEEDDPAKDPDETPVIVRPPKPPREKTAEEQQRSDNIDLKCLLLCIGMLERVNGTLEDNSTLDGILQELIIPSVKRKEFIFREKGLISLGLCCLIAKRLALNTLNLFVGQALNSPEALQTSLLQVIFDVLMVHEADFHRENEEIFPGVVAKLIGLLASETSDKVRALLCIGLSKLILAGMITKDDPVIYLIQNYLSPMTADNQELRQCLTFFFQVFCYSSPVHQETMRRIFLPTYKALKENRASLDDGDEMVSSAQIAALFLDWTDPHKLRQAVDAQGKTDAKHQANMSVQLDLAIDIVRCLLKGNWEKEDKKVFCQMLGKLHIPDDAADDKVKELKVLMHALRSRRPIRDTTTNNSFTKFETAVAKKFEKQLEDFSEEEYRKLEQLEELFEFLDSIIPDDDDDEISIDERRRKGKKRRVSLLRSESIMTTTTENEDASSVGSSRWGRSKPRSKRPRLSKSDAESDDDDDDEITELPTPPVPTRTLPKRSAAMKKPPSVIYVDSDDDEYTPVPRSKQTSLARVKEDQDLDAELDAMPDTTFDSIMDADSQDEEEEVNDLLAED
ncbi:hypothetical protein H0H87_008044 [Tephrocybe sp. NHM501043]|nr:hypothetical protein H0H87_008044 [Tephrocybe sp. NHM501043]